MNLYSKTINLIFISLVYLYKLDRGEYEFTQPLYNEQHATQGQFLSNV